MDMVMVSRGLDMVTTMANVKLKLKQTLLFCIALMAMALDIMAMLVWDTMDMLVLDILAMVMVLAMGITMERGKLNLQLRLKLTQLFFTAPMDMVSGITGMLVLDITVMLVLDTLVMLVLVIMAMATMARSKHRWCNHFLLTGNLWSVRTGRVLLPLILM